jgi:hypothetical protein
MPLNQKIKNNFYFPQAARSDFGPKAPGSPACFYILFVSFPKSACQARPTHSAFRPSSSHSAPSSPYSHHGRSRHRQAGQGPPHRACHPELLAFHSTASPTEPHQRRPSSSSLVSFPLHFPKWWPLKSQLSLAVIPPPLTHHLTPSSALKKALWAPPPSPAPIPALIFYPPWLEHHPRRTSTAAATAHRRRPKSFNVPPTLAQGEDPPELLSLFLNSRRAPTDRSGPEREIRWADRRSPATVHGGPRKLQVHEPVDTVHGFLLSEIIQNPIIPMVFRRGP